MSIDYDSILAKINEATSKTNDTLNSKNILKIDTIGNIIIGRFLPNMKNIAESVYHYYHHGWKSKLDGNGMFYLCLNTFGEKCPICTQSIKMWKSNDPIQKDSSKGIRRRENWLVNFYVISDLKNPANNGTIKILRFGKQIDTKYKMATTGVDKEIYGSKIWRLDNQGCSFRIMCEQNSESKEAWPTYNNSGFLPPSAIEGMTDEKARDILSKVYDLPASFIRKSAQDMANDLQKHYFTNEITTINNTPVQQPQITVPPPQNTVQTPVVNNISSVSTPPAPSTVVEKTAEPKKKDEGMSEDQIDAMLKELQGN